MLLLPDDPWRNVFAIRHHPSRSGFPRRLVGILGELLVTSGVLLLLFVVYELWWTNIGAGQEQDSAVAGLAQQFDASDASGHPPPQGGGVPAAGLSADGVTFAVMYVPRFGEDYARPVTDGVGTRVLDHLGIGHYPETQLPGQPGNFAIAGHRQSHGAVFWKIDKLGAGDQIYIQTREGFYTYTYRSTEIVHPSASEVLLPVPREPGARPGKSLLTMTSCDPPFTTQMRIVVQAELTSWQPLADGPPGPIRHAVESTQELPR